MVKFLLKIANWTQIQHKCPVFFLNIMFQYKRGETYESGKIRIAHQKKTS